jgi:hypothetical protein
MHWTLAFAGVTTFYEAVKSDELVKSRILTSNVIPAKAGIQEDQVVTNALDPGFRRGDDFLRGRQISIGLISSGLPRVVIPAK